VWSSAVRRANVYDTRVFVDRVNQEQLDVSLAEFAEALRQELNAAW
jgi:hypothetical protein